MAKHKMTKQEKECQRRFDTISPLLQESLTEKDRRTKMKEIQENGGPSIRTLKRYYNKYLEDGFYALTPKIHNISGEKTISDEILEKAVILRRENPKRSINDIILIMELNGMIEKGGIKRSTLQKRMQEKNFSKKEMMQYVLQPGISAHRFQKNHRMDQIQSDFKYAMYLPIGKNGEMIQLYWICWIDDYSRMILDGRFYTSQSFYEVETSLKRVIQNYGIPSTILLDNGSAYIDKRLKMVCSKCGITIYHARPYNAKCKGKVERRNSMMNEFLSEAVLDKYTSLEEVNENYKAWERIYHNERHRDYLKYGTPTLTFKKDTKPLRFIDGEIIKEAFLTRISRKVNNDATVSIDGTYYEVSNPQLIGLEVEILFDPQKMDKIVVRRPGYDNATASKLKIKANITKTKVTEVEGRSIIKTDRSLMTKGLRNKMQQIDPTFNMEIATKFEKEKTCKKEAKTNLRKVATSFSGKLNSSKQEEPPCQI